MTRLTTFLAGRDKPLVVPGAHDALSAKIIAAAGFDFFGVGGAGLAASQLGVPDIGVQSFGEYRDAVRRIREATPVAMMVDGENGFGDAKAVDRTVRTFDEMGIVALSLEDLDFPPRLDRPPSVIPVDAMVTKLRAAIRARKADGMSIIARTDAAYCVDAEEAIRRAKTYQAVGVDAIMAVGMPDFASLRRLREELDVALIVLSVVGAPWYAPTVDEAREIGADAIVCPAAVMLHAAAGIQAGLDAIRENGGAAPVGFDFVRLAGVLNVKSWADLERS